MLCDHACEFTGTYTYVDESKQQVNADKKSHDSANEFPQRHRDHGIVDTEPEPDGPTNFAQVKCAITVNKPATIDIAGSTEACIVVQF